MFKSYLEDKKDGQWNNIIIKQINRTSWRS
jgi:hypothetical protein